VVPSTFDHFAIHGENEIAIDGTLSFEKPDADTLVKRVDLSTTRPGQEVRAKFVQRCGLKTCTLEPGAEVSIAGVGRATLTRDFAGSAELVGRDHLIVDLKAAGCPAGHVVSDLGTQATAPLCVWDPTPMPTFDPHATVPGVQFSCTTDDRLNMHVVSTFSGHLTLDLEYGGLSREYTTSLKWDEASKTYVADMSDAGCQKTLDGLTGYFLMVADGTSHGRTELFTMPRVTIAW
jgi:hypothetical protein